MKRTKKYLARLFALAAIVAVAIAVVVIVSGFDSDSNDHRRGRAAHHVKQKTAKPRTKAKTYTIESGDTLTAIAHKTGVPLPEILALNPEVDPQILIAGHTLKLR